MPHPFFPFYALGFRRNPFGALTDQEWADCAVLPPALSAHLPASGHLQLIGPKGCGKTTHLLALGARFSEAGAVLAYEHLPMGQHRFYTSLAGLDCFLLDEAQRLGPLARGTLFRAAKRGLRLVIATHADLSRHAAWHGITFTTWQVDTLTTPAHLEAVIARRLAAASLNATPAVTLSPEAINWLWSTYRADLRATLDHLYNVFQRLDSPGVLTVEQVAAR